MNKKFTVSSIITIFLGFVSFCWLIYDTLAFEYIRPKIVNLEIVGEEVFALVHFVFIGYFVLFLFHLAAFLILLLQINHLRRPSFFHRTALLTGILSLIALFVDYSLLSDIGKEYKVGASTQGEWLLLYIILPLHALFTVFVFILIFSHLSLLKKRTKPDVVLKDDNVFTIVHYVGISCGFIGLGLTVLLLFLGISEYSLQYVVVPYTIFILFPYGLVAFYWVLHKMKEKPSEWYDEKQFQDINKAGFITLLLSLPFMMTLFVIHSFGISRSIIFIWFPSYLFFILFLFSTITLFLNRRT